MDFEEDPKLNTIAALHELDSEAAEALEKIDAKLEGATDETIPVNVEGLRRVRNILYLQKYALKKFVESQAEMDDLIEKVIAKIEGS